MIKVSIRIWVMAMDYSFSIFQDPWYQVCARIHWNTYPWVHQPHSTVLAYFYETKFSKPISGALLGAGWLITVHLIQKFSPLKILPSAGSIILKMIRQFNCVSGNLVKNLPLCSQSFFISHFQVPPRHCCKYVFVKIIHLCEQLFTVSSICSDSKLIASISSMTK